MKLDEVADALNERLGEATQNKSTVSRFERKERSFTVDVEKAFADVFGVSVSALYDPPRTHPDLNQMLVAAEADERLWRLAGRLVEVAIEEASLK